MEIEQSAPQLEPEQPAHNPQMEHMRCVTRIVCGILRGHPNDPAKATDHTVGWDILIRDVSDALKAIDAPIPLPPPIPALPINKALGPDKIVCLDCGANMKMLTRHIKREHDLTPHAYRRRWNLASDYPMACEELSNKRRDIAKNTGLGIRQQRKDAE